MKFTVTDYMPKSLLADFHTALTCFRKSSAVRIQTEMTQSSSETLGHSGCYTALPLELVNKILGCSPKKDLGTVGEHTHACKLTQIGSFPWLINRSLAPQGAHRFVFVCLCCVK